MQRAVLPAAPSLRAFHGSEFRQGWLQIISNVHVIGTSLINARIVSTAEEWQEFVLANLPCDLVTACRVIKLAENQQIPGQPPTGPFCFHDIIKLPEPVFRFGVHQGRMFATCSPAELSALKKEFKAAIVAQAAKR